MNAILPQRLPKKAKRSTRWKSQAHLAFVRGFACANCGSMVNIQAAHVRMGSGAGLAQKPDDWRAVPICAGCHIRQHEYGEETFWREVAARDPELLIEALIHASPKRGEIERVRKERRE